ncbi:hypothetical protein FHU36_002028 [Nonomuraea muscovyensis]|uniref:Transposase DDE domain-containing protein n=1 Tax=Nonomuraea muscovyensis TaxID=1124761 RepID=A0A7X0BZ17_9ACTN|nr:hypothetical protein [Nonomuraea muscovyensis]
MKTIASQRKIAVSADGSGLLSQAGALLLLRTLRVTGLDQALSTQLQRWRPARAVHDPGKILADLAITLALGGDCLADICCAPSPTCSGTWPLTLPSPAWSIGWPPTRPGR